MRLEEYINKDKEVLQDMMLIAEMAYTTESIKDNIYGFLKKAAGKLGFKIHKTNSIIDYLKKADNSFRDFFRSLFLYMSTDITNKKLKNELTSDMKKSFKRMSKKDLIDFIMLVDKSSIGLSAHLRHILQGIIGIEISSYHDWTSDIEYVETSLSKIRQVMKKMEMSKTEMDVLNSLEKIISSRKGIA